MKLKSLLATAIAVVSLGVANAEPIPAIDLTTVRRLSRPGPHGVEFSNRVKFRVPDNLRYVSDDKLESFMEKLRLPLVGDEVGAVVPEDVAWFTIIFLPKDDPLANQPDLTNLDKAELMKWQEKFTSDHALRNAGSGRTYTLGNWTHPPKWDAEKKTLEMGVRLVSDSGNADADLIDHKLFVYGPDKQIVLLATRAPMADGKWNAAVKQAKKLQDELTPPPATNESSESEEMMYYAKLAGGGLFGTLMVIIIAKIASRRRSTAGVRRPGLPR
jgi:hypothetical protein